jgi:ribosomal protein S1
VFRLGDEIGVRVEKVERSDGKVELSLGAKAGKSRPA